MDLARRRGETHTRDKEEVQEGRKKLIDMASGGKLSIEEI
jgi:hypothetical protein